MDKYKFIALMAILISMAFTLLLILMALHTIDETIMCTSMAQVGLECSAIEALP
jgi:hypothetical protein